MSRGLSLKEAERRLEEAAQSFAPIDQVALELWLQAAEGLPSLTQDAEAMAATHLVHAALQEAPWRMQNCDSKQAAWLQKHLPGISTTMHMCASSQLGISNRRISILQALLKGRQQPYDAQHVARLESERKKYMLVEVLTLVVLLILPIAVLCDDLASSKNSRDSNLQHMQRLRDGCQHSKTLFSAMALGLKNPSAKMLRHGPSWAEIRHTLGRIDTSDTITRQDLDSFYQGVRASVNLAQQHRVRHGSNLISALWSDIRDIYPMRKHLHAGLKQARQALLELNVAVLLGPAPLTGSIISAQGLVAEAGPIWVNLVCQLPAGCTDPLLLSDQFYWQVIESQSAAFRADQPLHTLSLMLKAAKCAQQCRKLKRFTIADMQPVLHYFQEQAQPVAHQRQLQESLVHSMNSDGMPEEITQKPGTCGAAPPQPQQQLQQQEEEEAKEAQPALNCNSTSDTSTQAEKLTVEVAVGDYSAAPGRNMDLDDMQALLRLMYGCTIE